MHLALLVSIAALAATPLGAGEHALTLEVDGWSRSYNVHVPPQYDPEKPTAVVLVFHGATMNARRMPRFTGMDKKSNEAGFIVVYLNGTGVGNVLLTFSVGGQIDEGNRNRPDDVKFVASLLDEVSTMLNVDQRRVYATGFSNGGMMCYRLAAELSDRIAAIAPVAGTTAVEPQKLSRPVPIIHFHGTRDLLVPVEGPGKAEGNVFSFKSLDQTLHIWCSLNGCSEVPTETTELNPKDDGTKVVRKHYAPKTNGAEIVLYVIEEGGHSWPGLRSPEFGFLGKTTLDITATDLIWEFFEKHPLK